MPPLPSIADCATCTALPPRIHVQDKPLPGVVDALTLVVEVVHEMEDQYDNSHSRLLRCPVCGTHYLFNHYEEEFHYPHQAGRVELDLRRLDPAAATEYLEGIAGVGGEALPAASGQVEKAFAHGAGPARVAADGDGGTQAAATRELVALRAREDEVWRSLEALLVRDGIAPLLLVYVMHALLMRAVRAADWTGLRRMLLAHRDPAVRLETAALMINVGTENASVVELLAMSTRARAQLKKVVKDAAQLEQLVAVCLERVPDGDAVTLPRYSHGLTDSAYGTRNRREAALYALALVPSLNAELAKVILKEVERLAKRGVIARDDERVKDVIDRCKKRLARKPARKPARKR